MVKFFWVGPQRGLDPDLWIGSLMYNQLFYGDKEISFEKKFGLKPIKTKGEILMERS